MTNRDLSLATGTTWAGDNGLPLTLLLDYDGEYIGEVGTYEYVNKASEYFTDFYGRHITNRIEKLKFKAKMRETVIRQIKCIIEGKSMEQGLDAVGVWMSKDILFPQILEAHQVPTKKMDLVALYNHIHKRR